MVNAISSCFKHAEYRLWMLKSLHCTLQLMLPKADDIVHQSVKNDERSTLDLKEHLIRSDFKALSANMKRNCFYSFV